MSVSSRIADAPTGAEAPTIGRAAIVLYRLGSSVLLLALAAVAAAVFLVALDLLAVSAVIGVFAPVGNLLGLVTSAGVMDRALVAGAAAVVSVAALALLVRAPRTVARNAAYHILQSDEKGLVVVGSESVETVAVQTAVMTAGVLNARVKVRGRASGPVRLNVRVEVLPGADVKRIGPRVQESVCSNVEELVGLTVRDANVEVHVMDPDDIRGLMR